MSGVLKPVIVIELLLVMLLAGVGTAFAIDPNSAGPTATPGPSATPVAGNGFLTISEYYIVYDAALSHVTGVTVTVHNKDTVSHSGIVNVAVDQEDETITGNESVSNLAAGASIQVTVNIGPVLIQDTYLQTLRVVVTQTQ
jgi:hypothetical protein